MVLEGTQLMLDETRLRELLVLTEELPTVEFKLKYVLSGQGKNKALDELAKDIIALTNTGGRNPGDYAYLVIGAGDTLKSDGTRDHDDVRQCGYDSKMFLTIANARCSPPIPNLSYQQIEIDGRCYGILTIPPSPHMHSLIRGLDTPKGLWRKSSVLIRHRDEVAVASFEEMTIIKREKERLNATDDRNVTNAGIVNSGPDASQGASLSKDTDIEASRAQVLDTLNSIQSAVEKANEKDFRLGTDQLDPFNSVRHHLLSTALMSLQMQSTMLGVHDAQRLYSYRERLEPLQVERILLFRMLLNDQDGLVPGWYWSSWLDEGTLRESLFYFALRDRNESVRVRAREILAAARIPPPEELTTREMYLKRLASDESVHVKKAGIAYLGAVGDKRELPTIKRELSEWLVGSEATISRLLILARTSPAQVLTESIPKYLPEKARVISELEVEAASIRSESLVNALKTPDADEDIKVFAIEELTSRNELTDEIALSLLKEATGKVAEICYRHLIEQGQKFSVEDIYGSVGDQTYNRQYSREFIGKRPAYADAEAVILALYKSYAETDLWKLVDWESDLSEVAYKALALYHFDSVSQRIREDLNEKFASYEKVYLPVATAKWKKWHEEDIRGFSFSIFNLGLRAKQNEEENTPEASARKETDGIKNKYTAAALAGILENGENQDVLYGRRGLAIDDYDVRVEAVRVIEKFGDEDDVQALVDIAMKTEGLLQELSAKTALKLSSDRNETVASLLPLAKDDLATVVVGCLVNHKESSATRELLERMLLENNDVVRRKSVAFFTLTCERDELEELLVRYTGQPTYYYDVVCWLDRILYAPAQLREMFLRQLESELV
jgi:hypothetical protein